MLNFRMPAESTMRVRTATLFVRYGDMYCTGRDEILREPKIKSM